jgi:16S rRNA (cytosine1407-C5)-methyltransferase
VLQNWGAANTAVTAFPGEKFGAWFPECFDRVLLDAPCSMENLRSSESHPMRPISNRERQGLAQRQARLLASALQAARTGGEVVYATCTLAPKEDEAVLDSLLHIYPGAFRIENLSTRLPALIAPALTQDETHTFEPSISNALRLWPHRWGTSGFFSALLVKTGPVTAPHQPSPQRSFVTTGLVQLPAKSQARLAGRLLDQYGLDIESILTRQRLSLWQRGSLVHAIPDIFIEMFAGLPFHSLGLLVGEDTPDGLTPSHEFVARFGLQFPHGRLYLPDDLLPPWLSGSDLKPAPAHNYPPGSVVAVFDHDNRLLGRGKILPDRIKNLLLKRLF